MPRRQSPQSLFVWCKQWSFRDFLHGKKMIYFIINFFFFMAVRESLFIVESLQIGNSTPKFYNLHQVVPLPSLMLLCRQPLGSGSQAGQGEKPTFSLPKHVRATCAGNVSPLWQCLNGDVSTVTTGAMLIACRG